MMGVSLPGTDPAPTDEGEAAMAVYTKDPIDPHGAI